MLLEAEISLSPGNGWKAYSLTKRKPTPVHREKYCFADQLKIIVTFSDVLLFLLAVSEFDVER